MVRKRMQAEDIRIKIVREEHHLKNRCSTTERSLDKVESRDPSKPSVHEVFRYLLKFSAEIRGEINDNE